MGTPGSRAVLEGMKAFIEAVDDSGIDTSLRDASAYFDRHQNLKMARAKVREAEDALVVAAERRSTLEPDAARAFDSVAGDLFGRAGADAFVRAIANAAGNWSEVVATLNVVRGKIGNARSDAVTAARILGPLVPPLSIEESDFDAVTIKFAGKVSMDSLGAMESLSGDFDALFRLMGEIEGRDAESPRIRRVEEGCLEITVSGALETVAAVVSLYASLVAIRRNHFADEAAMLQLSQNEAVDPEIRERLRESANRNLRKKLDRLPDQFIERALHLAKERRNELRGLLIECVRQLNEFIEKGGSFARGIFSSEVTHQLMDEATKQLPEARDARVAGILAADTASGEQEKERSAN